MPNTINVETELDGERNLVLQIGISGDGSGDEAATQLVDISDYSHTPTSCSLKAVSGDLTGFSATLLWDATTDEVAHEIPAGHSFMDFEYTGGGINRSGTGKTGDIMITTVGLGSGDKGSIRLELRKKY